MLLSAWVVAYDIHNSTYRQHCLRTLRAESEGYQKSVFEIRGARNETLGLMDNLAERLEHQDSLLAARTLPYTHAWQLGTGPCSPDGDLLVIT
jgi:CRISPR/Cas system-associated endoribonuclease Cas2